MEFYSPVYELLYKYEQMGIKIPRNWDVMPKVYLWELLQQIPGEKKV
jgi:hypothetical protein